MSPLHLLQVAVGFFTPDRNKKEVNQFAGLCDKQSPCMSGVLHTYKSEWRHYNNYCTMDRLANRIRSLSFNSKK